LQYILEFQGDHAQWRSKGGEKASGDMRPEVQALEAHLNTLYSDVEKTFFQQKFRPKYA